MQAEDVKLALQELADPARANNSAWFFKTGPGQYGEGDRFMGVTVPRQRTVAAKFRTLDRAEVVRLLQSSIHEFRLTALFILVDQYRRGDRQVKKEVAGLYYKNRAWVNNWDLVDSSAAQILGDYLLTHSPIVLLRLSASKSLWDRRMAIISTFAWIKRGQFDPTLQIVGRLIDDKEDLIHKACGWALREVGKKNERALTAYLDQNAGRLPRTTLRYAIERLAPEQRRHYMY